MNVQEFMAEQDGREGRNIARFDIAEALSLVSHDYGLYALHTALSDAQFRPSPLLRGVDDLEELGREVYDACESDALKSDPYSVPDWAEALLAEVRAYENEGEER